MGHWQLVPNLSLSRTMCWKASRRYPRITIYTYPIQRVSLSYSSRSGKMLTLVPVVEIALNRVPADVRSGVIEIIHQSKSTPAQKRALLLKKGLLRSTADELEILAEVGMLNPLFFFCEFLKANQNYRRGSRRHSIKTRQGVSLNRRSHANPNSGGSRYNQVRACSWSRTSNFLPPLDARKPPYPFQRWYYRRSRETE